MIDLDVFVTQYLETALWSSTQCDEAGNNCTPLDEDYSIDDFAVEALLQAIADCDAFREDNADDLALAGDDSQNGHDFWLTRNRHGAGFWDRGYGEVGTRLSDAAHVWGSVDPYIGDNGKVYFQ